MLKQGVHPKIVSERLGHASVLITLDTYSHVLPGLQEAAARRFDEAMVELHGVSPHGGLSATKDVAKMLPTRGLVPLLTARQKVND
jgi:hypothetical protein